MFETYGRFETYESKVGSKVSAWFKKPDARTRLKYDLWHACLEHKFPNGTWKVVWTPAFRGPNLPFDPIEDDWLFETPPNQRGNQ